jgi:hypothetical protein
MRRAAIVSVVLLLATVNVSLAQPTLPCQGTCQIPKNPPDWVEVGTCTFFSSWNCDTCRITKACKSYRQVSYAPVMVKDYNGIDTDCCYDKEVVGYCVTRWPCTTAGAPCSVQFIGVCTSCHTNDPYLCDSCCDDDYDTNSFPVWPYEWWVFQATDCDDISEPCTI